MRYRSVNNGSQIWMWLEADRKWRLLCDLHIVLTVADENPVFRTKFVLPKHQLYEVDFALEVAGQ